MKRIFPSAVAAGCAFALWAPSAFAKVTFYTDWNCKGYSFSRNGGQISNLKSVKFKYRCEKEYSSPSGRVDIPYWTDCERHFGDIIRSVKITNHERVELFKHDRFRGDSEYIDGANGCYNLSYIPKEASAIKIYP